MRIRLLLLFTGLVATSAFVQAQQAGPVYVVEAGDSLFSIAQIFGTTVEELAQANQIDDPGSIFPGQPLVIR